jgi:hypothetical protein
MIRLNKSLEEYKDSFLSASPFDHVVIDDFLAPDFTSDLCDNFPQKEDISWWMYDNPLERKLAFDNVSLLHAAFRDFFAFVNSESFLDELRQMSGIQNLIADPRLRGGGLHMIMPGGKLDIHEDFNVHKDLNAFRRINLIFYLNRDWKEEWGGNLELWNKDMTECERSVAPAFNRAVIFRTDQGSNHGHPHQLACPEGRARISLASYYYEPISEGLVPDYRSTVYKKLPGESNDLDELREKRKLGRIEDRKVKSSV